MSQPNLVSADYFAVYWRGQGPTSAKPLFCGTDLVEARQAAIRHSNQGAANLPERTQL